jgi:hypothetical protein
MTNEPHGDGATDVLFTDVIFLAAAAFSFGCHGFDPR